MMTHNFRELKIWQRSMELTTLVYKFTMNFPAEEKYGLTSQIRRCAVSIPSNIAEGAGRKTKGEFNQFLGIANGSSCELMTQLILTNKLGLLDSETIEPVIKEIDEIQKMIRIFSQKIILSN